MITYEVRVCIGQDDPEKRIAVKCHDTGVNLMVYLQVCRPGKWRDETEPYWIPAGSTAVLKVAKPDKTYCVCDGELTNGGVLFHMPPEAFTASGVSRAEVSLFGADTRRLTSATFDIHVPEECIHETDKESESYVDVMGKQIKAAIDAAETATTAAAHQPTISDAGTWLVWDAERVEYVDTGTKAQGSAAYKPYPVTLTQSGNKWTADHTLAEVKEALAQGYSPYCIYNTWHIPCTGVEDNFIYYTGWLGAQTTAVFILQSESNANVIARNTFGTDYLSHLVDSDGSFGRLSTLIKSNPRTAVVYNLGGTPSDGQDLSSMTFPVLLWGTATDAIARTQTFGLTGAGGDQWRAVHKFDTGEVTFEQVGAGTKIYTLTPDQETGAISVNCTWAELAAAVKSGATVMLDTGALEPGASHIVLTARRWYFDDDGTGEVYFQSDSGIVPGRVFSVTCFPGENDTVGLEPHTEQELTEDTVGQIAYSEARAVASDLEEQIAAIDKWDLIQSVKTTEDVTNVVVNRDSNGNPFYLTKLAVFAEFHRPAGPGTGTVTTNIPIYLGMNGVVFTGADSAWLIGYSPTNAERMRTGTHSVAVFESVGGKMLPTHIRASLSDKDSETSTMVTNPTPLGKDLGVYGYYTMERYSVAPCRSIELRNSSETKISIFKGSTIEV